MDYLSQLAAYSETFRAYLHRLRADQPDALGGDLVRVVREFLDLSIPADQAAAWTAAGIPPGAARLLTEHQITPAEVAPYIEHFRTTAPHLPAAEHAVAWILAAQPADIAAAWAACGFSPAEAAPLITEGITPPMPTADQRDAALRNRPGDFLYSEMARIAEQQPDLIINPHRAGPSTHDTPPHER